MVKINIIKLVCLIIFSTAVVSCAQEVNWDYADKVLENIIAPTFNNKDYNILSYGAKGDGVYECTEAINKAIDDCSKNGGGRVIVPEGTYLTGAIYLKSNVNLHIKKNAILKFSTDKTKYLPLVLTRYEGVECMNYSPLIYSYKEKNIAVTGEGILDGQGSNENWWFWKGKEEYGWKAGMPNQDESRNRLFEWNDKQTPVEERILGENGYLRPVFIQFYNCENILISGVKLLNSPMWFLNPVLSKNISIIGLHIEGLGPNNDGCNPESCENVLIKDCFFNTGDDCIAIKSGRNNDGRRIGIPSSNIIVKNCKMEEGHGGIVMGSEISGGVRNVFVEDCEMSSPNLDRAVRIKTNSCRGGFIENIFVRNVKVGEVKEAVLKINFYYEEGDKGDFTPTAKNIVLENVTSEKSKYAIWVKAYERAKVEGLIIKDSKFNSVESGSILEGLNNPKFENCFINNEIVK